MFVKVHSTDYLSVTWSEKELEEVVNRRVDHLVKEQYTGRTVTLIDLLPATINKNDPIRYLLSRTMMRPRDIIMFFNECIKQAEGKPTITLTSISQAETIYSENRLRALADEWFSDYQNLIDLVFFLKKFPQHFHPIEYKENFSNCVIEFLSSNNHKQDSIYQLINDAFDTGNIDGFMQEVLKILYRVGVVGIKQESFSRVNWSYQGQKLNSPEVNLNATIHIHPAFWRVLGISHSD